MNGQQCKKLRKIAKMKAISWKETTTQGIRAWKNVDGCTVDPRTINNKEGNFFQRKLHPASVGAISKKLKKMFKNTVRRDRNDVIHSFSNILASRPDLLGLTVNK